MSSISAPYTFSPNTTASSSQVNANFSTIYNDYNGGISATNLAAGAVTTAKIADSNVTTAKIADSNVTTAKIADSGVTAAKLATNAILLGYAARTSDVTMSSATPALFTGLSSTVTIPAGGRSVKITGYAPYVTVAAVTSVELTIWDGTVGSGTQLAKASATQDTNTYRVQPIVMAVVTPAAGAKTYNIGIASSGAASITAVCAATSPAFILVEVI